MSSWVGFLAAATFIVLVNLAANFLAQAISPTLENAPFGRRFSYRVVFAGCLLGLLALCALVLLILDGFGYQL